MLRTVADTSGAWISRLRLPMNLEDWFSLPKEFWSGPEVGVLSASQQADRLRLSYVEAADPAHPNGNWSLDLRSADGQPLKAGIYANVYSSWWFQRPPGVPTLDLVSGAVQPSSVQGQFIIHELIADDSGRITRLALDFTSPQGSGPVQASGSIRTTARCLCPLEGGGLLASQAELAQSAIKQPLTAPPTQRTPARRETGHCCLRGSLSEP